MSKVLITGGTGFAGSHLIEALLAAGYSDVHTTAFGTQDPETGTLLPAEHYHRVDLTNSLATNELIARLKPEHIYHLAAFAFVGKSFIKAAEVFQNNTTLQLNVLEAVREHVPSAKVLIVGSAEEYGVSESEDELPIGEDHPLRPVNPYAVSKITQNMLGYAFGKSFDLQIYRVRPFNHIGERQSEDFVVPAFVSQVVKIERGEQQVLKVGNLDSARDFSDVKDVVKAYIKVMETGQSLEVYNIGSGKSITMRQLLEKITALSSAEIEVVQDESRLRPSDIPNMVADINKISALGWQPEIDIDSTLERVINWYRQKFNASS